MCKIFKKKSKFRTGSNFTSEEKKAIINAINYARKELNENCVCGLCYLLRNYLLYNKHSKCIYNVLKELYYNPEYYNLKGLKTEYLWYWWPIKDKESRLKALDILEQAVIND